MFKPSVICSKSKSSNHYVIRIIVFRCQFVLHSCSPCISITVVDIQNHLLLGFRGRPLLCHASGEISLQVPFLIQRHPQEMGVHIHLLWPKRLLQQIINAHHFSIYDFKGMGVNGLNKLFFSELRI